MTTHGHFVWTELATSDPDRARAFYAETLGWTFEPLDLPDAAYWVARAGEALVGGVQPLQAGAIRDAQTSYWFPIIEVDDVDARTARARAAGAEVVTEPYDTPGVGRMAIIRDPTGSTVGWMTSAEPGG